jgi:two-component system invasion response regulator UvrY
MITVMLVDDHAIVRAGLRRILDTSPDLEVIAEACSGEEAMQFSREYLPDIVIMDVNMPGMGGLEATRRMVQRHPDLKVIALSMHSQEPYPSQLLAAGAMGYLSKECSAHEVLAAIHHVVAGRRYLSLDVAGNLAATVGKPPAANPLGSLSTREMEVMHMFLQGCGVKAVATRLNLSPKTVTTYRQRLFAKLGVSNDIELVRLAVRNGLLKDQSIAQAGG